MCVHACTSYDSLFCTWVNVYKETARTVLIRRVLGYFIVCLVCKHYGEKSMRREGGGERRNGCIDTRALHN